MEGGGNHIAGATRQVAPDDRPMAIPPLYRTPAKKGAQLTVPLRFLLMGLGVGGLGFFVFL
jgi:hypothetical protein